MPTIIKGKGEGGSYWVAVTVCGSCSTASYHSKFGSWLRSEDGG